MLKQIMAPRGEALQICYNCSGLDSTRIVSEGRVPPPRRNDQMSLPAPPQGKVDFGVTNLQLLWWAYNGTFEYSREGPKRNLRTIGMIEHPMYTLVAVRAGSFITDLAQIKERRIPVRILADENPYNNPILEHYGLTREAVESWGGKFVVLNTREDPMPEIDVIIHNQTYLANTPEANLWYRYSQRETLRFLKLPDALLKKMQGELKLELATIPAGMLQGMTEAIPTVGRSGQVVYGREDMPEEFAYKLAKTMDEDSRRFIWTVMSLSYNPRTVPCTLGVPLHPGARRYYEEVGYLKSSATNCARSQ